MWAKVDKPLQDVPARRRGNTRIFGYAGPVHRPRPPRPITKYIIVDMYAKAVQGTKAEDAVKWAEGELKKIYEAMRPSRP